MLSSSRSERLSDLDGMLHDLEQRITRLSRVAARASAEAPDAAARIGDTISTALSAMSDRFRGRARTARHDTAEFGDDLLQAGNDALQTLRREVNNRPLVTLAVAVGVGLLAAGLLARRD